MKPRLLLVVNDLAYFLSHRLPIALAAKAEGFEVHVACGGPAFDARFKELGLDYHSLPLSRSGLNPLSELRTFFAIWQLFGRLRPSLVHVVTIKPVLYGGIAARLARVPALVSSVAGLGYVFIDKGTAKAALIRRFVAPLFRFAFGHVNQRVIFQNTDDRQVLVATTGIPNEKAVLIRGSGVDLTHSLFVEEPVGTPVVAMASRLLKDKGVGEFVEAAGILRARGVQSRFWLIGSPDPGNPASVTPGQIQAWQEEGVVEYLGYRDDVLKLYAQAHVIVLPSYREGLPKTLIEAAACGRAVVTTDVSGCRDAIEPNVTGVLVPARDAGALADAIARLLADPELRQRMGRAGHVMAEREFGIDKVIAAHIAIYRELICP